jgi:Fe-S-cluster-containing hydrogenase component 2
MNADTGIADKDKCIVCLRCIANCPDDVLKVNDISSAYTKKVKREKLTEEVLNNKMSKILL